MKTAFGIVGIVCFIAAMTTIPTADFDFDPPWPARIALATCGLAMLLLAMFKKSPR